MTPEEQRGFPPAKLLAVLRTELEGRLSALSGGDKWDWHMHNIKWLAAEIWELEQKGKASK